ncbi:hypothetical protein Tco_0899462 [Tanacetum coccineum]
MLNTNNNLQTQTSNALHNAIMEAGGINNDIYSIVDACLNACEMWKAIERLKQDHNKLLPETKENEIDKLIALITLSFKKIYKPTNKNLRTSSNTSKADQDNTPRINRGTGYDNKRVVKVVGARENVDAADNSGPIFDAEPLQKVQNDDDNYNMFPNDREHPEQLEYVNVTYMKEHGDTNITTDSLDMSNNG